MNIPNHVAIIPDGNRRWARTRALPIIEGHRRGAQRLEELAKTIKEFDIKVVTFWAFSTENWDRTEIEVRLLMSLFELTFKKYTQKLIENKIHFTHIGRKDRIPGSLLKKIQEAELKTKNFNTHYFALALDYGGKDEIIRAIQKIKDSSIDFQTLKKERFDDFLDTRDLPYPNPDLIIRTGGEMRTSGFLIWQSEYAEFIFVKKYFPDFTSKDLQNCIQEYSKRQRRFGK